MADPAPEQKLKEPEKKPAGATPRVQRDRVVIRSYPKTIFLYPLALVAIVCGALSVGASPWVEPRVLGFCFAVTAFFNFIVVSFEFRRHAPVVALLVLLVLVLGGVLLNERLALVAAIGQVYHALRIEANAQFYFATAAGYLFLLVGVLVASRFEYWEVRANEVLHHTGLLGDCERFPVAQLTFRKEITDVFEWVLLGAGRIVIHPSGRDRPIVLENVPRINEVEEHMEELLDSLQVVVEK